MKTVTIIVLFMIATMTIQAQDYLISFAGTGQAASVDSVQVLNLNQGTRLTLPGTDILHLLGTMGIPSQAAGDNHLTFFPNPASGLSRMEFLNPCQGEICITVSDISGRRIEMIEPGKPMGRYTCEISRLKAGVYFANISASGQTYSGKLVSMGGDPGTCLIKLSQSNTLPGNLKTSGNSETVVPMQYTAGDRILFKGFSGIYARVLTLVPTQSQTLSFDFISCTDYDNNHYQVVTIGTQTWMAENLRATRFVDGSPIPLVTDSIWENVTTPARCWYDNDSADVAGTYGALYNFYVTGAGNPCPSGWHVPDSDTWGILTAYLGGASSAGGPLKETGIGHWSSPNVGATNETGFSALPGGIHSLNLGFIYMTNQGHFWTSHSAILDQAWRIYLNYNDQTANLYTNSKKEGESIRCIKD